MIDESTVKRVVAEVLKHIDIQERIHPGQVPVGVSGRHVHVSQADLETLFGKGYKLSNMKDLSQPGQFAAKECVMIVGSKGVIEKCRILGPTRGDTQIEVSMTDTFKLGVPAVIRDSGKIQDTPGCVLVGPKGAVTLSKGVIVAARHLHLPTKDAERFGLKDMDRSAIKTNGPRSVVLNNVLVRVNEQYGMDFHIDMDEANAAGLKTGDMVDILA